MTTLWEVVTGNSILPIEAANTFWDHLNNQKFGAGTVYGEITVELMGDLDVELEGDLEAEIEGDLEVELEGDLEVEVCS